MKKLLFSLMVAATLGFTGCASTPQTPQQTVFVMQSAYNAAAGVIVAYKKLPQCSEVQKMPCSEASVVTKLQAADSVAYPLMMSAQAAVRGNHSNMVGIIETASQAVNALTAITATIEVNR